MWPWPFPGNSESEFSLFSSARLAANLQGVYSSQLLTRRLPAFPALVLSVSADSAPETIAQIVFGSELMYGGRVIVQLGWRHSSLSMEQLEQMSMMIDEPTSVKLTSFFGMFWYSHGKHFGWGRVVGTHASPSKSTPLEMKCHF